MKTPIGRRLFATPFRCLVSFVVIVAAVAGGIYSHTIIITGVQEQGIAFLIQPSSFRCLFTAALCTLILSFYGGAVADWWVRSQQ